ncbi:hypothetical protein BSK59_15785 [Paenibacillus odorifer]|uniref:hypothetical protein n=1 Tax=Paenibacillus odorifer TaxID=189426 RepID=UPI00096C06BC|nr:hypothetical protein [Paenibacillus odorifer]OME54041.1 hypothetical protein BSK59_15785 [Paenibacillus odorifer]
MTSTEENEIIEQVGRWFAGYKTKRVSNHLTRVEIGTTSTLKAFKTFLGFKFAKEYDVASIELAFDEQLHFTRKWHGHVFSSFLVECAVDNKNKVVYWKAVPMN